MKRKAGYVLWYASMLFLCGSVQAASAQRWVGRAAPPLHFDSMLQTPTGTRTDWPSLRGKVVVLEFWATWCLKCIEDFPRLNELASSVDSNKVVFVSITDEDAATVEHLLTRRRLRSLVAIDKSGATFRSFGIQERPTTIVVDTTGHIAAITDPDSLTASELADLATGRNTFPKPPLRPLHAPSRAPKPSTSAGHDSLRPPVLEISAWPAKPGGATSYVSSHNGDETFTDLCAANALAQAYSVSLQRIRLLNKLPTTCFDIHLHAPTFSAAERVSALKLLTSTLFDLEVTPATVTQEVYVLTRPNPSADQTLTEAAMSLDMTIMLDHGDSYLIPGRTAAQLASALEGAADLPVVDETGISGVFDWQLAKGDFAAQRSGLLGLYGIRVEKGMRTIRVIEVRTIKQDTE